MLKAWHSCINKELMSVEELIKNSLKSKNIELTEMCQYVVSGGKRIRPAICILSYYVCGGRGSDVPIRIGVAFEIIHSATLIHDDIND